MTRTPMTHKGIKWRSIRKPSRTPSKKRTREATYSEMIQGALQQLPGMQGTLDEIYHVIERRHARTLNFELEAGPRHIPVWKASVRKIINLNGLRFPRTSLNHAGHPVFSLAPTSVVTKRHSHTGSSRFTERDENSSASTSATALFKMSAPRLPSVNRHPSRGAAQLPCRPT